jgi:hypothetical protein
MQGSIVVYAEQKHLQYFFLVWITEWMELHVAVGQTQKNFSISVLFLLQSLFVISIAHMACCFHEVRGIL